VSGNLSLPHRSDSHLNTRGGRCLNLLTISIDLHRQLRGLSTSYGEERGSQAPLFWPILPKPWWPTPLTQLLSIYATYEHVVALCSSNKYSHNFGFDVIYIYKNHHACTLTAGENLGLVLQRLHRIAISLTWPKLLCTECTAQEFQINIMNDLCIRNLCFSGSGGQCLSTGEHYSARKLTQFSYNKYS